MMRGFILICTVYKGGEESYFAGRGICVNTEYGKEVRCKEMTTQTNESRRWLLATSE